jgi:cephalosporin hydroxylase
MYDKKFEDERKKIINKNFSSKKLLKIAQSFNIEASLNKYTYGFNWLGVPIIQYPQDVILMQELLYNIKPDLVIETGIARSGSLIFYSSILSLIHKKFRVIRCGYRYKKTCKKSFRPT